MYVWPILKTKTIWKLFVFVIFFFFLFNYKYIRGYHFPPPCINTERTSKYILRDFLRREAAKVDGGDSVKRGKKGRVLGDQQCVWSITDRVYWNWLPNLGGTCVYFTNTLVAKIVRNNNINRNVLLVHENDLIVVYYLQVKYASQWSRVKITII